MQKGAGSCQVKKHLQTSSLWALPFSEYCLQDCHQNGTLDLLVVPFEDDDKYCTAVANNVQDARKLLETGFEYVCSHKDEMLFRKRK
jgi:hypothetical protein